MTTDIIISVIIPTYNRKERLIRCLHSVAANDLQNCEVIVVDDGSIDGSADLVTEKYPWVTLLRQQNCGVSRARNHGMKVAQGEFIAFLDSDDMWYPERLAVMKRVLEVIPRKVGLIFNDMDKLVGLAGENISYSDAYFGILRQPLLHAMKQSVIIETKSRQMKVQFGNVYRKLISGNILQPSCVILNRRAFLQAGGFREDFRVANDSEYFLRLSRSYEIAYVPLILTTLEPPRMSDSLSNRKNSIEKIINMLTAIQEHYEMCEHHDIKLILLKRKAALHSLLGYHYLSDLRNEDARNSYKDALAAQPYNLKFWIMRLFSFLPHSFLQGAGRFKSILGRLFANG